MGGARRRTRRRAARPGALVLALVAIVAAGPGCSEDDDLLVADGPVVAWHIDAQPDGMSAFVGGTLVLDGDCLLLEDQEGTSTIVWPRDTTWDDDREAVETTDGTRIIAGDPVMVGGGYVGFEDETDVASTARELLDDGCVPTTGQLAVANLDSDVGPIG